LILIKLAVLALSSIFFLAVTATALAGFLVLTGAPKPCVDRAVQPAPPPNAALQANWNAVFAGTVSRNEATAFSLTEAQATMLAQDHLRDKDVPVENLKVFFCPDGTTEAFGQVSLAGLKSDVLVKGILDVSRDDTQVQIQSIQAGNLPSLVSENLLDLAWESRAARTLPVDLNILSMDVSDGEAIVVVGP
jgi:hypothetical protein